MGWALRNRIDNFEINERFLDQIKNKELIQNTLGRHKFDIAFTEVYDYCPFGIFKLLNISTYIITSAIPLTEIIDDILGVPHPLSYVPSK